MNPLISIIVPNFNGKEHLCHFLPALKKQTLPQNQWELIVVDNGSTDDSRKVVEGAGIPFRWIPLKGNHGFAQACNKGAQEAEGEYVAFVNNDTRPDPHWLEAFYQATQKHDQPALFTGRILSWEGEHIDFIRGILTFDGHAFQQYQGFPSGELQEEMEPCFLPFPCGGNMVCKRELFLSLGGFDPLFFAYLEDVDFGWRAWAQGVDTLYIPEALIFHRGSATGLALGMLKRAFLYERNAFFVLYKNIEEAYLTPLMAAALLTMENRLFSLLEEAPSLRASLWQDPYKEKTSEKIKLAHPQILHTLRAYRQVLHHVHSRYAVRNKLQEKRHRSDKAYFEAFPPYIIPTYPGDELLFSSPFFLKLLPEDLSFEKAPLEAIIRL